MSKLKKNPSVHKCLREEAAIQEENQEPSGEELTAVEIHQVFKDCQDVTIHELCFSVKEKQIPVRIVTCDGLFNSELLNESIFPLLKTFMSNQEESQLTDRLIKQFPFFNIKKVSDIKQLFTGVFNGEVIIHMDGQNLTFSLGLVQHPQRRPSEPNAEVSIKGPRDGFIEELTINIGLIRKRLRTNTLKCEKYTFGERSFTTVALLYVEDIINEKILEEIKNKLRNIKKMDALTSMGQLEDLLTENQYKVVPIFNYTGRPDTVVQSVIQGRFAILMDGVPMAILAPVTLTDMLKSPEDNESNLFFSAFARFMRVFGLSISVLLPAFWVGLSSYHQDQIPLTMLGTLSISRKGVPFPSPLETILMLTLFELFREAGLRLPAPIGQTLTVVGGLIIGDAAIRAGITNPATIVVMATSVVSAYTLGNQGVFQIISVFRYIVLLAASFLGFFGLLTSGFLILIYIANVRPFGVPYASPLSPFNRKEFMVSNLRFPWKWREERPAALKTKDSNRQEN